MLVTELAFARSLASMSAFMNYAMVKLAESLITILANIALILHVDLFMVLTA